MELVVLEMFTLEVSGLRVCLNIVNPTEILNFCKSKFASGSLSMCLTNLAFRQATKITITTLLILSGNYLRLRCVFLDRQDFFLGPFSSASV